MTTTSTPELQAEYAAAAEDHRAYLAATPEERKNYDSVSRWGIGPIGTFRQWKAGFDANNARMIAQAQR